MLAPQIIPAEGGVALTIAIRFRELDVRWVPSFVSEAVVRTINSRLEKAGAELRWDLSQTLSFSFDGIGERSNIERVGLDVSAAPLAVSGGSIQIEGPMTIGIRRAASTRALPAQAESGDSPGDELARIP